MNETLEPVTNEVDQQELAEQLLAQSKEQDVDSTRRDQQDRDRLRAEDGEASFVTFAVDWMGRGDLNDWRWRKLPYLHATMLGRPYWE